MSMTEAPRRERLLTIGTVCRRVKAEFPDISISKIRYLEDQGLLTPKRTEGGYRMFDEEDVERLETILRMQRDEFLPLRVIREELAAGASEKRRRKRVPIGEKEEGLDLDGLCERAGIDSARARELEDFGLLEPRVEGGQRRYSETDIDIAAACDTLVAPALRSRNPERRRAGIEDLQAMSDVAHELSQLLFWRNVRRLAGQ
jgi:DNA-binding transcriptional MerR regulator